MCRCTYAWWMVLELNVFEAVVCSIASIYVCVMFRFVLQSASGRHSQACTWGRGGGVTM